MIYDNFCMKHMSFKMSIGICPDFQKDIPKLTLNVKDLFKMLGADWNWSGEQLDSQKPDWQHFIWVHSTGRLVHCLSNIWFQLRNVSQNFFAHQKFDAKKWQEMRAFVKAQWLIFIRNAARLKTSMVGACPIIDFQKLILYIQKLMPWNEGFYENNAITYLHKQDHRRWRYHRRLLDYQSPYFQLIIE